MSKVNCWDFKKCGREPGGEKTTELGVCPATTLTEANGFLDGVNGGKACVYITGTFCSGVLQGTHKEKEKECAKCDFYKLLKKEHGIDVSVLRFQDYINEKNKVA